VFYLYVAVAGVLMHTAKALSFTRMAWLSVPVFTAGNMPFNLLGLDAVCGCLVGV
jgi:hypothetical protein